MSNASKVSPPASSRGYRFNTGLGPVLQPLDIDHASYEAVVDPDTAFWALVKKGELSRFLSDSTIRSKYLGRRKSLAKEMDALRFGLGPTAVYFNPTERCNLNCTYCYIPSSLRRHGEHMTEKRMFDALGHLKKFFRGRTPKGVKPQIIFHGSEPLLARETMFAGIDRYRNDFRFGIQTNGSLLDKSSLDFITSRGIGLGLSLDGHRKSVADSTRTTWSGAGVFSKVVDTIKALNGYPNFNVLCTATTANMRHLSSIVDFLHNLEVPVCMLNPVRCTREGARTLKPNDHELSKYFLRALDRSYELYRKTGRKLVIANFANVLVSIVAPTARRLMCDISPCGGGRCFFALSATGDLFPCSEFIGLPEFNGGNLFKGKLEKALKSDAFRQVTNRKAEEISPCNQCAIRHFCGAPCPAEAYSLNGSLNRPGAFCEFYEEQVRYAFRIIADEKVEDFLWDGWDRGTSKTLTIPTL